MNATKVIILEKPFDLKPYTKGELLKLYRPLSLYVLNKWLKDIEAETGPIIGRTMSVKQLQVFITHYGVPGQVVNEAA